jgi:hypothetical protein
MGIRRWCGLVLLAVGCRAESDHATSPDPSSAILPAGLVARVGDHDISVAAVVRIAQRQGMTPERARDAAIQDALFAAEARQTLANDPSVRRAEKAILAGVVVDDLLQQARAQGPVTDDELAEVTQRRWLEVDRPSAARTVHAVVLVKDPASQQACRSLAGRIAQAVRDARDAGDFLARARAVPAGNLEVRAEGVPPIALDGREVDLNAPPGRTPGQFDLGFARAAHALRHPGDQSPVVQSEFGFHVIMLIERLPEHRVSIEERRRLLADDVLAGRGHRLLETLLARLRANEPVHVLPVALELTASVNVGHEP